MTIPATLEVPLQRTNDGTLRVGGTRVTLDMVLAVYKQGRTAEQIVEDFPTLKLADVYAVLSYYHQNREAVAAYLEQQERDAQALREEIERHSDPEGFRERLLARYAALGGNKGGASGPE